MADLYVRSTDGSDASDGLTWANAKATLAGAFTAAAAGDRIFVSQVHAETQASAMTLTSPGTVASPVNVICGNDGAEPPTATATTATITTTGASNITLAGYVYYFGITFNVGTGATAANFNCTSTAAAGHLFDTCKINLLTTNTGSRISLGSTSTTNASYVTLVSCDLTFNNASQAISLGRGRTDMVGGTIAATGTAPTSAIVAGNASPGEHIFRGVDMSGVTGGGKTLTSIASATALTIKFIDCKLGTLIGIDNSFLGPGSGAVWVDNCDSTDTNYRMHRNQYEGNVTSTTDVFRTGGFTDGTTPISWHMASAANVYMQRPLWSPWIAAWQDSTGASRTATVEVIHDSTTKISNKDAWLEIMELGTANVPLGLILDDRATNYLSTAADQATSAQSWTASPLTNPNTQKFDVAFTPQEKGTIIARVALAKPSYNLWVDPMIVVTSS